MNSRFTFCKTLLNDLYVVQRTPIKDSRGYFERYFCSEELDFLIPNKKIKQINITLTQNLGAVRGMHFQRPPFSEVKFVILDKNDYLWSKDILNRHQVHKKAQVLFSPVYDKLSLKDLAEWILEDHLSVRLQTQLHKSIWNKDAIGV